MANFAAYVLTRTWKCYDVPQPAQIGDFGKALAVAEHDYRAKNGLSREAPLTDDWCEIHCNDEVVQIRFEVEVVTKHG